MWRFWTAGLGDQRPLQDLGRRLPGRRRAPARPPLLLGAGVGLRLRSEAAPQVRCSARSGGGRADLEQPPLPLPSSEGPEPVDFAQGSEMSSTAALYLLSTLGGYLVTSFLLLKYPTLLHQRKKQRFLSKHISHRGGERGPQNPGAEGEREGCFSQGELKGPLGLPQHAAGWK